MKNDLAIAQKTKWVPFGTPETTQEREYRLKIDALLEACKLAKSFLDGLGYSSGDVFESLVDAIANAEK